MAQSRSKWARVARATVAMALGSVLTGATCDPPLGQPDPDVQAQKCRAPLCVVPAVRVCIDKCATPVEVGAECSLDPCAPNGTCKDGATCMSFPRGSTPICLLPGVMTAAVPCDQSSGVPCASGLYCESSSCHENGPARCSVPQVTGMSCDSNFDAPGCFACSPATVCNNLTPGPSVCHKRCETDADCPCGSSQTCTRTRKTSPSVPSFACFTCKRFGDECSKEAPCCDGSDCGTRGRCCRALKQLCTGDAECCSGSYCEPPSCSGFGCIPRFGNCRACKRVGEACSTGDDAECCGSSNAVCQNNRCAAKCVAGGTCTVTDPYYGPYCKGTTGQRICLDRVTEHCQAKDDCYKPPPPIGGFVLAGYSYGATFIDTKPLYERKLPPSEGTPTALTVLGDVIYATAGPNRLKVFDTVKPSALLLDEALATPPVMVDAAHLFGSLVPGEPTSFDIVLGDAKQVRWMTYSLYSFKKTQDIPFTLSAPWVTGAGPAAGPSMSSFHPFAERGIERIAIATTTPKNGLFWVQLKKPTPVVLGSADFTALATPAGEPVGVTTGFEKVWAATRAPNAVVQLNQDLMDKIKVMPLATRVPIAIDGAQGAPALATDNFYVMVLLEGGSGEPPELRAYFSGNLDPLKAIIFPIPEVRGEPVTMKTTYEGDKPTAWIATRSPNTILRLGFKGSSVSVDQVLNLPKEPVDLIVTSGAHDWSFNAKSALHVMMK